MAKKVIDVSSYNGKVDWALCKEKGVKGAILKIIRKDLNKDNQFDNNYKGCHKNKIPWGVYNYSYATTAAKAKSDMKLVCDILDKLDKTYFKYGVWFDIEDKCQESLSKAKIAEIINAAKKVVESRGYKFGVYTGMAYYRAHIDEAKVNCENWWIARYYKGYDEMKLSTTPNASYKPGVVKDLWGWQYTSSGVIAAGAGTGNGNHFDLNLVYKEFESNKPPYTKITPDSDPAEIMWLQKKLNANCQAIIDGRMDKLDVDGDFGTLTLIALVLYWEQLGWNIGTYAGEKTCVALWKNRKK